MTSIISLLKRVYTAFNPPETPPLPDSPPIRFGILGAATIAPVALISPAKNHPEAVVVAVAARDKTRATAFAKKYGIGKVYGGPSGYQGVSTSHPSLLDDPDIDAVYNPLPNGLHYEWTMKALAAGKHVLLEKPSSNTAEETRKMFALAESKGLVLLEAFHYRFHPAIQRVKAIIDSGELGALKSISMTLTIPAGLVRGTDIRYNYEIGGGALMDMGCYTMNCIRYLSSSDPTSVLSASHEVHGTKVDRATEATLALSSSVIATLHCDLGMPPIMKCIPRFPQVSAVVKCEGGEVEMFNFVMPILYHSITVRAPESKGKGMKTRVEKVYKYPEGTGKGEKWWTTYRYQLEAFVDRVKGRTPKTWIDREDSIANIEWIEAIYAKTGLGSRPQSGFRS